METLCKILVYAGGAFFGGAIGRIVAESLGCSNINIGMPVNIVIMVFALLLIIVPFKKAFPNYKFKRR